MSTPGIFRPSPPRAKFEPCDDAELAVWGEICRDSYKEKRVIYQDRWGDITVKRKPMKRPKPAHVARAEREAINRICYDRSD